MNLDSLILERVKGMGIITVSRSGRFNAVSRFMYQEIHTVLEVVKKDKSEKVLVLTVGGRGFCFRDDFKGKAATLPTFLIQVRVLAGG